MEVLVCGQNIIHNDFIFLRRIIMSKKLIYLVTFVSVLCLVGSASAELVGHWRLDEGSGTTVSDATGNIPDGTFEGNPEWVAGYYSGALDFDGDDWVNFGNPPALVLTEAVTITCWVNPAVLSGEQGFAGLDAGYAFKGHGTGVRFTTPGILDHSSTNITLVIGEWQYVAATFQPGQSEGLVFYYNGEETERTTSSAMNAGSGPFRIGSNQWNEALTGMIDDVRVYNHILTDMEILAAMEGGEGYPRALGPTPKDGELHPDTWVNLSWRAGEFAVSHDVYFGENLDDVNNGAEGTFYGNQTSTFFVVGFPGFPYPDGLVPGTTYYWRIDEVNEAEPNSPWKGDIWSFMVPPKTAYSPDPADGAEAVSVDAKLSWTGGFGSKLHTVYFGDNFDDVSSAAGGLPQGATTYNPGPLKLAQTYYWRVDEFDAIDTYKGDVWSFTTEGAVGNPNPANGAVDITQMPLLTWAPGLGASHEIYFGTDKEAVKNADTTSPEYKGTGILGSESYDPGMLEWNTTYYWRIDEANNTNSDSPWTGPLWSFTTANFLIIDDFEDYDAGDNQIWYAWKDGLGYGVPGTDPYYPGNGSGSAVGDENTPSYTEETIVHGGNQAMPLFYDNNKQGFFKYSEAELTLTYPRDWTENGVNRLTIWFRGDSANAAEPLYVALNGNAIVTNDNPNAAQVDTWTEWNIDLQAFADQGVNLANVNTIALGLGNKNNPLAGGSGTMYFDDIRLYPPAP
jgi:hypothetical protein